MYIQSITSTYTCMYYMHYIFVYVVHIYNFNIYSIYNEYTCIHKHVHTNLMNSVRKKKHLFFMY